MKLPKRYKGYKIIRDDKQKWYGTTDTKAKTISINVAKSLKAGGKAELRDTIKHEKAHVDNPQRSERSVEKDHKTDSIKEVIFKAAI